VLDHDHGVGAAWYDPARRDDRGHSDFDSYRRGYPTGEHLRIETQARRSLLAGSNEIVGAHGEAVDRGAIEWRQINWRTNIMRKHAAQRLA
jgi:hypothetical protein